MEASAEVGHCFLHSEKLFSRDELEARMSFPHHGSRLGWGEDGYDLHSRVGESLMCSLNHFFQSCPHRQQATFSVESYLFNVSTYTHS